MRAVECRDLGDYKSVLSIKDVVSLPVVLCLDWAIRLADTNTCLQERPEVEAGMLRVQVIGCGLAFPDVLQIEGKHIMKPTPPLYDPALR